ncbi:MAG: cytochrome c-type biogenesis protein CcmH [Hyphomicrobium sp.]|nr:cytochrome c-type biogenesis protein CcmH [Hyphomicrobium sp.]
MVRWMIAVLAAVALPFAAQAVQPDEILPDGVQESRARALSAGLRCLVCQNQSIDDSDAPLARDLRLLVRERIKAGDDDKAVMNYVVARYGDFVLLKPPLKPSTLILWLSPLALLLGGIWMGRKAMRAPKVEAGAAAPLTDAERARLDELLGPTHS